MTVVSNTGPLIALVKANQLDLLNLLFGQIEIPPAVHRELFASKISEAARFG
jgi:predicted nucleic acid-binding protein